MRLLLPAPENQEEEFIMRGPFSMFRRSSIVRAIVGVLIFLFCLWFSNKFFERSAAAFQEPYATTGQWSQIYNLVPQGIPVAAVHMHVLPNGKVLLWDWVQGG